MPSNETSSNRTEGEAFLLLAIGLFLMVVQAFFFKQLLYVDHYLPLWMEPYLVVWAVSTPFILALGDEVVARVSPQ